MSCHSSSVSSGESVERLTGPGQLETCCLPRCVIRTVLLDLLVAVGSSSYGDCKLRQQSRDFIRWLMKSGVSDNVGAVKHFLSVRTRALRRARHFALVEDVALPYQPRPARNQFQVRNSVRPMHLFGHTFDHDY